MLLDLENVYKYFDGNLILNDICLTIEDREIIGLIGRNGCGKSTLLKIITGMEELDKTVDGKGSVSISGKTTIGFLQQNSGLDVESTIDEQMHLPFKELLDIHNQMKELESVMSVDGEMNEAAERYAELSSYFEARDGYRIEVKINTILNGMGFENTPKDRIISTLSGGEKTRLAMAKLLLEEPNLLILDEPTNHLDFKTLGWVEDYLKGYKGSVLIVSHDRYFLNKLCTRICEIENCKLTSYKGDYSAYLVQKQMNSERQLKEYEAQQKEIAKLEDYIVRNKTRASTAKMAKSRQAMLDRMEIVDKPLMYQKPPRIKLEYDIEPVKDVLDVKEVEIAVGEGESRKELVKSLDLLVRRSEHIAIVGANGIGKTSILKVLQGIIPHENGTIRWGGNVKISYFEQENTTLNPHSTVLDEIMRRFPRLTEKDARSALAAVLIGADDVIKPTSVLSGGERAKLCFAIMAFTRGNVLVLDEPTNHLDLATKEVLDDVLAAFEGTIILVSHDRYLINKVATKVVEVTENGTEQFEGNYDDYSEQKKLAAQAQAMTEQERKEQQQKAEYEQKKQNQYRSKQQRAESAKKRLRISELEKEIEALEVTIFNLENEIADPEIASHFELMSEKCKELEAARTSLDEKMDEWASLED
ncbi:MAG: ATP-binding cassette domain-containing protein [Ruminococcus sp.]|nr:ATP-binding cassette domain-containing protein [Ruminococcus sp.]